MVLPAISCYTNSLPSSGSGISSMKLMMNRSMGMDMRVYDIYILYSYPNISLND